MRRAWTVSVLLAVLALAGAGQAADAYTTAEIDRAAAFIAKMDQGKRDMLAELAKKAGKSVEETFLDIVKVTGGATLGEGTSNSPEQPDDGGTFKSPDSDDKPTGAGRE